MIRTAVSCLLTALLAAPVVVAAEKPKPPAKKDGGATVISETPAQEDSPLVRAAKAAQKARERKAAIGPAITDESVKKSTGRITVLSEGSPARVSPEEAERTFATMKQERADTALQAERARLEAESLEKEIARLEKELASIEEEYYDESDVELREDLSQRDFARTKADLAAARAKLAEARKRHQDLSRASSNVYKP